MCSTCEARAPPVMGQVLLAPSPLRAFLCRTCRLGLGPGSLQAPLSRGGLMEEVGTHHADLGADEQVGHGSRPARLPCGSGLRAALDTSTRLCSCCRGSRYSAPAPAASTPPLCRPCRRPIRRGRRAARRLRPPLLSRQRTWTRVHLWTWWNHRAARAWVCGTGIQGDGTRADPAPLSCSTSKPCCLRPPRQSP